jgi:RNA polymerase sigma factor (sigma-70 family)
MSNPEKEAEEAKDDEDGARLLGQHIAGDPDAFQLLFDRFDRAVRAYARRILGPEGRPHVDDAIQEAWFVVDRKKSTFDRERGKFKKWLKAIVRTECLDILRREGIRQADNFVPEDARSTSPDHDQQAAEHDLKEALEAMEPDDRRLLEQDMKDATDDEKAEGLGMKLTTFKRHLERARQRIRRFLPGWGEDK